jgi:hypothetical protein
VRTRRERLRGELDVTACDEVGEVIPLSVAEDAAKVKDAFGTVEAPAHPGVLEAHADEAAHGALDSGGADVEVVPAEGVVAHMLDMLAQVVAHARESLAASLVALAAGSRRSVARGT